MITLCKECGKEIQIKSAAFKRGEGKYCSNACYHKAQGQLPPKNCKVCGKEIKVSPAAAKRGEGIFCSRECDGLSRQASPWMHPELRLAATEAVRQALISGQLIQLPCVVCGEKEVEAHHQDYSKPLTIIWFCRSHHISWHRNINGF